MFTLIPTNHFAVAGGIELITEQAEQATSINESFDSLWQSIFIDLSGPWVAVNLIASVVLSYAFIAFILKLFLGVMTEQWSDVVGEFVYLIILVSLIANNARPVADLALFVRNFTDEQIQNIYEINLSTVTVETAIRDILITADLKSEISNRFRACDSKTGTLQIDCLKEVAQDAQELITQAQNESINSTGLTLLSQKVANFIDLTGQFTRNRPGSSEQLAIGKRLFDGVAETVAISTIRLVLKAIQFALVSMIELARLLVALVGPVAVALSTIPGKPRPIESWLIGMIGLSTLAWSYVLLVGFSASLISVSGAQDTAGLGFLVLLAFGSPLVAAALATLGGGALVRAISTSSLIASRLFFNLLPF